MSEKMLTTEREQLRLCAIQLRQWSSILNCSNVPEMKEFAIALEHEANQMFYLHSKSESRQLLPNEF